MGAIYILHASWLHRYEHAYGYTGRSHSARGAWPIFITSFLSAYRSPDRTLFALLLQPLLAVVTTLSGRGGAGAAALVLAPDVDALTGNARMAPFQCSLRCAHQFTLHVAAHFDEEQLQLMQLSADAVLSGDGTVGRESSEVEPTMLVARDRT